MFLLLYPQHCIIYRRKCTNFTQQYFYVYVSKVPIKVNSALAAKYSNNKCCMVKHSMLRNVYSTHTWSQPFYKYSGYPVNKTGNQNHQSMVHHFNRTQHKNPNEQQLKIILFSTYPGLILFLFSKWHTQTIHASVRKLAVSPARTTTLACYIQ